MNKFGNSIRRIFTPAQPLPAGMYQYQAPQDDPQNYRLHLRLEPGGNGMLVINASTILHLNQTASELAYHLVHNTNEGTVARLIANRYKVSPQQALYDFRDLKETINLLITRNDLDPEIFLDLDPSGPEELSTPLRLDCAITYRLPPDFLSELSPTQRAIRELSTEEWKSVIDKAWKEKIPHILFTGGEPTLREDLPELIRHTESNGQVCGLLTDGHKLRDPQYFEELLLSGLDHLLYLLQPENENSWQGLENSLKADIFITTHITLTQANVNDINLFLERLALMGGQTLSLSCKDIKLADSFQRSEEKAANLDLRLVWDLPVPFSSFNPITLNQETEDPGSQSRKSWLYIEPDGDVRPSQESTQVLGNFLTDSIEVLWKPERLSST